MLVRPSSQYWNVFLLAVCQAIFLCGQTTLFFIGGLIGFSLTTDKTLATLPISAVILGTALMTIPASLLMRRVGRRNGFMLGAVIGIIGMLICAFAVYKASFWLLIIGTILIGFYNAFCQYYRFAAADSADETFRPKAISLVLAGGVVAGVLGPQLALYSRDLLEPITYMASYIAVAGLTFLALIFLSMVRIPRLSNSALKDSGRSLKNIARQPGFLVAVFASMISYGVMSLLMTATPLAMISCGFEDRMAGYVIQWHVIGMFAPSFFTGSLIKKFGLDKIMLAGALLLLICLAVSLSGESFNNFWLSLLLLGLGWNFLFVGGTTLLTMVHTPAEQGKVQAVNDFLVFAATASASFMSGALLASVGWFTINLTAVPLVAAVVLLAVWLVTRSKSDFAYK